MNLSSSNPHDSIYGSKIRLHPFSDRLEIFSPGTIPNTMTIESISQRQSARNEPISSLLARCPMNVDAIGRRSEMVFVDGFRFGKCVCLA